MVHKKKTLDKQNLCIILYFKENKLNYINFNREELTMFDRENKLQALTGMGQKSYSASYEKLKKYTVGLPDHYNNPGRHVWTHLEFLKENYNFEFKSLWGLTQEKLLADALVNFINDQGQKIPINTFRMNKNSVARYDDLKSFSVDVDILLNEFIAIFSKTCFRERYKQADRDSFIMERFYGPAFEKALIFFKEHDGNTSKDAFIQADRVQRKLISETKVITVYDEEAMYNFFNTAIKRAENNYYTIGE